MSISFVYSKHLGQIICDITENIDGSFTMSSPCIIQLGNNQVGLIPLFTTVKQKNFKISKEDLVFQELFEPEDDIRNYYSSNYGSGLQLVTN